MTFLLGLVATAAVVGTIVGVVVYIVSYNRLVTSRQTVDDARGVIDLELQRRHHLIPELVETVKQSAVHERRLLDELMQTDRSSDVLVGLRERYPHLDSQRNFLGLQHELAITEDRIGSARRFHNIKVAEYNRRTEAFPSTVVACIHGFGTAPYVGDR